MDIWMVRHPLQNFFSRHQPWTSARPQVTDEIAIAIGREATKSGFGNAGEGDIRFNF